VIPPTTASTSNRTMSVTSIGHLDPDRLLSCATRQLSGQTRVQWPRGDRPVFPVRWVSSVFAARGRSSSRR
jgi:hypothetical protein